MIDSVKRTFLMVVLCAPVLVGCATAKFAGKVAVAPAKIVYKGAELGVKGTYYTGKYAAIGSYEGTKLAGKGVYYAGKGTYDVGAFGAKGVYYTGKYTGKGVVATLEATGNGIEKVGHGVYYIGMVPLKVTNQALNAVEDVLTITVRVVDTAGRVADLTKKIQTIQLDAELAAIRAVPNVLEVLLDAGNSPTIASAYTPPYQ